jgi:hypothetical protein
MQPAHNDKSDTRLGNGARIDMPTIPVYAACSQMTSLTRGSGTEPELICLLFHRQGLVEWHDVISHYYSV